MTDTTSTEGTVPTKQALAPVESTTMDEIRKLIASTGANPAELKYPIDRWGFTSEIKKVVLKAASSVKGQDDKHELLMGVLAILLAHVKARKGPDAEVQARMFAEQERAAVARRHLERVSGTIPGSDAN